MAHTLNQFYTHLKSEKLKPIYLLASDVTLLRQEARDILRKVTLSNGFLERETSTVEIGFDWSSFFSNLQNYNLLSDKVFVELNHPHAKFDDKTTQCLQHFLEDPPDDKTLLVLTNKLTSAQQKTRWFKAIEKKGLSVTIPAMTKAQLPQWIQQRARQVNLNLNRESILLLTELTEGNLLATQQALEKLRLLYSEKTITEKELLSVVSDNARFNVFDLGNLALNGQAKQAIRTLRGLKNTGTESTLILWAICREIRELIRLSEQKNQGMSLQQLLQSQWQSRRPLLKSALTRLSLENLNALLVLAEKADRSIKGIGEKNPWHLLERLILDLCGIKIDA